MKIQLTILIVLVLAVGTAYLWHLKVLFHNSQELLAVSRQFPTDYYVGQSSNPEVLYIAMGNSITQGTGVGTLSETYSYVFAQAIAQQGYYVRVRNTASSGARIADVLQSQLPQLANMKPNYLTLTVGTNDATHFTDLRAYRQSVLTLLNELEKHSQARVFLTLSADAATFPALPFLYSRVAGYRATRQNQIVKDAVSKRDSNTVLVDLYDEGKLTNRSDYASDLFHPNASGYKKWADLFIRSLRARDGVSK